jgi:hypothetical protein
VGREEVRVAKSEMERKVRLALVPDILITARS